MIADTHYCSKTHHLVPLEDVSVKLMADENHEI